MRGIISSGDAGFRKVRIRLVERSRIPGGFTTFMGMSWSGAAIGIATSWPADPIRKGQLKDLREFGGAGAGKAARKAAGRLLVVRQTLKST